MELEGKRILLVGFRGKESHIKTAKEQGVLFDLLIDASEMQEKYRTYFENVYILDDIFDWNQLADVIEQQQYDGVFTRYEDFTVVVSAITHHLKLPGVAFIDALKFRNKFLMREAFKEHSVPSADYVLVQKPEDAEAFVEKHSFPLIVKQISGIHSKYVAKVENQKELEDSITFFLDALSKETGTLHGQLKNFYEKMEAPDHFTHLIVEECITGEELTVDAFVVDGKVYTTPVCIYTMPEELGFDDHHLPIRTMPYDLDVDEQKIVDDTVEKSLKALGANYCVTHVEVFFNRATKECRLIEVASRGGGFRAEMVRFACGGDYDLGLARACLGLDPDVANMPTIHTSVVEVFAPENGTLQSIDTSCLENQEDVHHITWNRRPGCQVGRASDGKSFILKFLVGGSSYEAAIQRAKELLQEVRDSITIE